MIGNDKAPNCKLPSCCKDQPHICSVVDPTNFKQKLSGARRKTYSNKERNVDPQILPKLDFARN